MEQTRFLQLFSDEIRLRCLVLVAEAGDISASELVKALDLPQPKVSRHMTIMRSGGLITANRRGQRVYYAINPKLEIWQQKIVQGTVEGCRESVTSRTDIANLSRLAS